MPDREKVIRGLKCLKTDDVPCNGCPYYGRGYCITNIASDALDLLKEQEDLGTELTNAVELIHKKNERIEKLLKEQEAKCLSKDELNQLQEHEFVWYESFEGFVYCMEIIGICYERSGKVSDIQFNTPTVYIEKSAENYGKQYRIWTKQPTNKQMSNLKWN